MQSAKSRESALHLHIGIDHAAHTHMHLNHFMPIHIAGKLETFYGPSHHSGGQHMCTTIVDSHRHIPGCKGFGVDERLQGNNERAANEASGS
jgi:hypothetical protein